MIEILTEHRVAVCLNCSTVIREFDGDLSRGRKRWLHDKTGTNTCPWAPQAVPVPYTIKTAQNGVMHIAHGPHECRVPTCQPCSATPLRCTKCGSSTGCECWS